MTTEQKKFLDGRSTPYIIKLLRSVAWQFDYDPDDKSTWVIWDFYMENGLRKRVDFSYDQLKQYLATRPHVMNKKESRQSRINRKKSGVSRTSLDKKKKKVYIQEPKLIRKETT